MQRFLSVYSPEIKHFNTEVVRMLGIDDKELFNTIEALLFVSGDPLSLKKLSDILNVPKPELEIFLSRMMDTYNYERRGIKMIKLEDSYQLTTRSEYFDAVVKMVTHKEKQALSPAALEVLSIISYNQPITKAAIEKVRGVDSAYSLAKLLERDLIKQKGRLDAPGRPLLYVTTDEFLRLFGLESIEDMPSPTEEAENVGFEDHLVADNITFDELTERINKENVKDGEG